MAVVHFIIAVGADDEKMTGVDVLREPHQKFGGRLVEPLQVVEEQHQRMLGTCDRGEEAGQHSFEQALALLRRQLRQRRLIADHQGEVRDQIDHQLAVLAHRVLQRDAPMVERRAVEAEDLAH